MEGAWAVRDDRHARAVPSGNREGHDQQSAALPAAAGSVGEVNAVALMIRKGGAGTALRDLAGVLIRGTVGGESLAHRGPRHSERDAEQTYRGGEHGYRDTATFAAFVVQLLVQKS